MTKPGTGDPLKVSDKGIILLGIFSILIGSGGILHLILWKRKARMMDAEAYATRAKADVSVAGSAMEMVKLLEVRVKNQATEIDKLRERVAQLTQENLDLMTEIGVLKGQLNSESYDDR